MRIELISRKFIYVVFLTIFFMGLYFIFKSSYAMPTNDWYTAFEYNLNDEEQTINLKKYIGSDEEVVIPSSAVIDDKTYHVVISNEYLFAGSDVITKVTLESGVKALKLQRMFRNCANLKEVIFNDVDTSEVTDLSYMFSGCTSLETISLKKFDTSNVTIMDQMFVNCYKLKEMDLSGFDMRKVTKLTNFIHNFSVSKIIIGPYTKFYINNENGSSSGAPFGRGIWKKVEDGTMYNAVDISLNSATDDVSGTYVKQSDIVSEMNIDYNVNFKINNISNVTFTTTNDNVYEFVNNKLYVKNLNVAPTDDYVINDKAYFILSDAVSDAKGNNYDLKVTIDNVHLYDINVDSGYSNFVFKIFSLDKNINFNSYAYTSIEETAKIYSRSTIAEDATFEVIDKSGNVQEGNYVFSASDLDVSSDKNKRETGNGYGDYSEGFTLIEGFDDNTYKMYPRTSLVKNGNRIYGTMSDEFTELSEFTIKVDAKKFKFTWTGQGCSTAVASYYQPTSVKIINLNENSKPVKNMHFELYRNDSETPDYVWTSSNSAEELFLMPGSYTIRDVSENSEVYQKVNDSVFYVYSGDKVSFNGNDVDNVILHNMYQLYPYTVNYIDKDTKEKIISSKVVNDIKYGSLINSIDERKEIKNYIYDTSEFDNITIGSNENVVNLYYSRLHGGVTEKHIDEYTDKVLYEDSHDMLVGENYNIAERKFDGYNVIESKRPTNAKGIVDENAKEVVYYYRKVFKINVDITKIGGSVTGSEEVLEGMDSTPNNIVIKANEGYAIESISVNGSKVEVTNKNIMTLDKFVDVHEDKEINVSFAQVVTNVPKTDSDSNKIIIGLFVFSIGIVFVLLMPKSKVYAK